MADRGCVGFLRSHKRTFRTPWSGGASSSPRSCAPVTNDAGPGANAALDAFLAADTEADADRWLAALFGPDTDRLLRHTIVRALGAGSRERGTLEDVIADARMRLVSRVRDLRARPGREPIADFPRYVATVGFNAAYVFLRARYPARSRLKNKIRYAISRHPRMRLRDDAAGSAVCEWSGPRAIATGSDRQVLVDARRFADEQHIPVHGRPLGALVADIVCRLDRGIELNALVTAVATLLGVSDSPGPAHADAVTDVERLADTARDLVARLDDRQYLEAIWAAIRQLQPRQRAALLLNLRDRGGGSALRLFPLTGIASMRDIAAAVEMPVEALARLWTALPLDDLQIGAQFGITRQQVINLRKTARATLARRLAAAGLRR